jgi:hypothetical protein
LVEDGSDSSEGLGTAREEVALLLEEVVGESAVEVGGLAEASEALDGE